MRIGVTGHQDLGSQNTISWVESKLRELIGILKPSIGFSSLAIGADQTFAKILIEFDIPLFAVIPNRKYQNSFSEEGLLNYQKLLKSTTQKIVLDFEDSSEESFWAAGKYVVDNVDTLLAVWDGEEAQGLGGTGDVVKFAIETNKAIIHINPNTKEVKEINYGE